MRDEPDVRFEKLDDYRWMIPKTGRMRVPGVHGVPAFHEAVSRVQYIERVFIAWEQEKTVSLLWVLRESPCTETAFIVGPEGGFTSEEVAEAKEAGAVPVSLGLRTLRAETAAIVGSALIVYREGFGG